MPAHRRKQQRRESDDDGAEPWYAAKMIVGWYRRATGERLCYEERIVLVHADDFDDAWAKAESEANQYCKESDEGDWHMRLESIVGVYHSFERTLRPNMEVYSICRKSNLDLHPDEFVERFYGDHSEESESNE